jgi:hypothetical protein
MPHPPDASRAGAGETERGDPGPGLRRGNAPPGPSFSGSVRQPPGAGQRL